MSASALAGFLGLPKATEELIALLSEREVEFLTYGNDPTYVIWDQWTWAETKGGYVTLTAHPVTPEQAVEATLGPETCHTVAMDCFGNPPYNISGLHGNSTACGCSECGTPWSIVGFFRGNKMHHNSKACPICGRKVVDE